MKTGNPAMINIVRKILMCVRSLRIIGNSSSIILQSIRIGKKSERYEIIIVTTVLLLIVLSGATVQGKETVSGNSSVVSLTTGKAQGQVLK